MRHIFLLGALVLSAATAVACGDANTSQLTSGGPGGGSSGATSSSGASGTVDGTSSGGASSSGSTSGGASSSGGTSGTTSSGGSSGGVDAGPPPPPPPASACVPNYIQAILNSQCVGCHSSPPVNGSLSALTNLGELSATAKEDATKNEAQLSLAKLKGASGSIMPPGGTAAGNAAAIASFQKWINSNYTDGCAAGTDAGPPPPPPSDVFTGQPPYTSGSPNRTSHHAGADCLSCHNGGGDAPQWSFGGTITNGAGGGIAHVEVRLVDTNGKGISVYTDSLGNFWSGTSWSGPAHVGARNATGKVLMVSPITQGGCASCHKSGGAQAPIHLP